MLKLLSFGQVRAHHIFALHVFTRVAGMLMIMSTLFNSNAFAQKALSMLNVPAVIVTPPNVGQAVGQVHLPDGNKLDVKNSKTAGLQEAIQYASDYGWDLFVLSTMSSTTPAVYPLNAPLKFPSLQGKVIRFENVILDFSSKVTKAAMEFDSTMMVDLRLLGELRAPYAETGILFLPRSPVPLDGPLLGISGSVDSRFRVEKITSRKYGFRYDNSKANHVNNVYYIGATPATVRPYLNESVLYQSVIESTRETELHGSMKPLWFNPLDPENAVIVIPPEGPIGNPSQVYTPEGSLLDITGSETCGLQEAVNYAAGKKLNLIIYGRGLQNKFIQVVDGKVTYPNNGFYQINKGVKFPSTTQQQVVIFNATLNYAPTKEAAMAFYDVEGMNFELAGQIVSPQSPSAMEFISNNEKGMKLNQFRVGHLNGSKKQTSNVVFSTASKGEIKGNQFVFHELLSAQMNIWIKSNQSFADNGIRAIHAHEFHTTGVQIGDPSTDSKKTTGNYFELFLNSDNVNPAIGVDVGGYKNKVFMSQVSPDVKIGLRVQAKARDNQIIYSDLAAQQKPILDDSLGRNQIIKGAKP